MVADSLGLDKNLCRQAGHAETDLPSAVGKISRDRQKAILEKTACTYIYI